MTFSLTSNFKPQGDQPEAIEKLIKGLRKNKNLVLLGVTGSGKTFTIANVIAKIHKPTLILAHNKTLAAQLYQEFKSFFPVNAVHYFISYYDYYQPEAYMPRSDTYIEKSLLINDEIDKFRLAATKALIERPDVIIVSSVSCIYGLGTPENYLAMRLKLIKTQSYNRSDLLKNLVLMHYQRNDLSCGRGSFCIQGEVLEIYPFDEDSIAFRIEFNDSIIEEISVIDTISKKIIEKKDYIFVYPGSHHAIPEKTRLKALESINEELNERLEFFSDRPLEQERLLKRTRYDLAMIQEIGFCKGIENYSRHFSYKAPGEPPSCLLDYFPNDYLLIVDESHQTIPQLKAMHHGDLSRKKSLVEFGFRLPSAFDNRPLTFEEAYERFNQVIYVSATPSQWEISESKGEVVEQIIRPTGLLDPLIEIRPAKGQIDDVLHEIHKNTNIHKQRTLIITLTKKLAEDVSHFLENIDVKACYLHSDIETFKRIQILSDLRNGFFDVLIGVNLLREGLDLPEVSLVAILDADKQGFLRSFASLIQFCGRAARNSSGRVIMYADTMTQAIKDCLKETKRRRSIQEEYNKKNNIVPSSIIKNIEKFFPQEERKNKTSKTFLDTVSNDEVTFSPKEIRKKIAYYQKLMKQAAKKCQFEEAAHYRDLVSKYRKAEVYWS